MALTVEQVEQIIDDLEMAMATGASSVTIDGRVVQYRTVADMQKALTYFKAKLAALEGTPTPRPLFRRINLGFGYEGTQTSPEIP